MRFRVPSGILGEYYLSGVKHYTGKEYDKAILEFEKLLKEKPSYADIWYYLALSYYHLGRAKDGLEAIQHALRINPNYSDASQAKGRIYLGLFQFQKAMETFEECLRLRPFFADLHLDMARACFHRQHFTRAEAHLKKAIDINPSYANAFYLKGLIACRKGNLEEATRYIERATDIDAHDPVKKSVLCVCYYLQNKKERALKLIENARKSFPKESFYQLIDQAIHQRFRSSRLRLFKEKIHPILAFEQKEAFFLISLLFAQKDKLKEAEFLFQEGMNVLPDHPEVPVYLAAIMEEQGDKAKAQECLEKAVELHPENAKAYFALGILYYHQDNHPAARQAFEKTCELDPISADGFFYLGEVAEKQGEREKARELWEKALEIEPDHPQATERLKFFSWHN